MRQSHQKSRSRGRGRKPQNPLSRNYESNGPDVKIRGNASHIAEKYTSLARDAQSNGDTVMAENYLQHAEHYNRIVAAAQAQRAEERQANGQGPQPEIEGAPAEISAQQEAESEGNANSATDGSPETDDEKPRRQKSGRGRRPRNENGAASANADDQTSSSAGAELSEEDISKSEVTAPEPAAIEAVSEDAAKLPDSITGGLVSEES